MRPYLKSKTKVLDVGYLHSSSLSAWTSSQGQRGEAEGGGRVKRRRQSQKEEAELGKVTKSEGGGQSGIKGVVVEVPGLSLSEKPISCHHITNSH